MKILSMTATFGKLSRQVLTLNPDLNIIEAPNEWGKSTWCAFIMAMLYGINTREQSKTGFIADKEHYAPWSGAAMSGRMDILWNDRKITIERSNKGKTPFGAFRAYETETGLEVPELTADTCGQTLLGVERSVFQRAGFLKFSDLPVSADETLRRRLNALVTTGDESNTGDVLMETLHKLQNNCRSKKTGLLPKAEEQRDHLLRTLQQMDDLITQKDTCTRRQAQVKTEYRDLENHLQALAYQANLTYSGKVAAAQAAKETADKNLEQAELAVQDLPTPEKLNADLAELQNLQAQRSDIHTKAQMLPPLPAFPEASDVFRGMTPEEAVNTARQDARQAVQLQKQSTVFPYGLIAVIIGALVAILVPDIVARIAGVLVAAVGIALLAAQSKSKKQAANALITLLAKYRGADAAAWEASAVAYAESHKRYDAELVAREQNTMAVSQAFEENDLAIKAITGDMLPAQFQQACNEALEKHRKLDDARIQAKRAEEFLLALSESRQSVEPPQYEDNLTLTEAETRRALAAATQELERLQKLSGSCQGQMEALGHREVLEKELEKVNARIEKLEDHYAALVLAQSTLAAATQELQRRFAPRISHRAQELMSRMTQGRYDRFSLDSSLTVRTGTRDEVNTYEPLWRSDGTSDQMYLALRLAVAEELTPNAPLILDDALVRFDDTRLAAALEILKETANNKQVILFTCQNREKSMID